MKKLLLTGIVCLTISITGLSQQNILPSFTNGNSLDSTLCEWNGVDSVFKQPKFTNFHTQNNQWNGAVDSNYCMNNAVTNSSQMRFRGEDIDGVRPVFIEADIDTAGISLLENFTYKFSFGIDASFVDADCSDTVCSKLYLQVRKPDSTGTGDTVVVYELDVFLSNEGYYSACFVAEKHLGQYLERFVIQLEHEAIAPGDEVSAYWITFAHSDLGGWGVELLSNSNINNYYNGMQYNLYDLFFETQYVAWHDQAGYPSNTNIHYIDLGPTPNVATPQNVDLIIEPNTNLAIQPFVEFRGAEVDGGGDYHTYTIINNGSDVCLMPFLEIVWKDGSNYLHRDGSLMFGNGNSCMLFDSGSQLIVDENAELSYGKKAVGMLGLKSGGEIVLKKNATLTINNNTVMADETGEYCEGIHVYMKPNSKLIFAEGANLIDWSKNGTMQLLVHMDQSSVDLSGLSEVQRELVVLIYDSFENSDLSLTLFENPITTDALTIQFESQDNDTAHFNIFDMNGKQMVESEIEVLKGLNTSTIQIPTLEAGTYTLVFSLSGIAQEARIIKL
jgi:hypothetical protein